MAKFVATITAKTRHEVCKAFDKGASLKDLIARFGISSTAIERIVREGRAEGIVTRARQIDGTLTQARIERIRELAPTHTAKQLHVKLGLSRTYVERLLKSAGIKPLPGRTDVVTAKVAELGSTHTVAEIAAAVGVSKDAVLNAAARADLPVKPYVAPAEVSDRVHALAPTHTVAEIAAEVGRSASNIYRILRRSGLRARGQIARGRGRKIDRRSFASRTVALARTHTAPQIAKALGRTLKQVHSALADRRVKALPVRPAPVAIPAFLPPRALPDLIAQHPGSPPLQVPRTAAAIAAEAVRDDFADIAEAVREKPAPADGYSMDALRKAFPEFEIPEAKPVFVRPEPAFVAEIVARNGFDGARERWPFLPFDELYELNLQGRKLVTPPAEEPLQPLATRIWRAIKRLFGRS